MAPDQETGKVVFGAMTLAHDGTFMAQAKFDDELRVMTGCYKFTGDKLMFCTEGKKREYGASLKGDCLSITHEDTTVKMCRQKACGKGCCGKCKCGKKCGKKSGAEK